MDFEVRPIEHRVAKPFIEQYHYSHELPSGFNKFFGAYLNGELYAVADYGMGSNMDKGAALARLTGFPVRFQIVTQEWLNTPRKNTNVSGLEVGPLNCLELKRLCRQGAKGKTEIPLTRFLAICHRLLKREGIVYKDKEKHVHTPLIHYIVSYSDPGPVEFATPVETWEHDLGVVGPYQSKDGHWQIIPPEPTPDPRTGIIKQQAGHIYRAANFRHLGLTAPEPHTVDVNGKVFHRRIAYKGMKRWNARALKLADMPDELRATALAKLAKLDIKGDPMIAKKLGDVRKELGRVRIKTPPKERWFLAL